MAVKVVGPAGAAGSTAAARMADVASGGGAPLATTAEAVAGTVDTSAVTPVGLKAALTAAEFDVTIPSADTATQGVVQLATTAEATAGTDTTKAVTASGLAATKDVVVGATNTLPGKGIFVQTGLNGGADWAIYFENGL